MRLGTLLLILPLFRLTLTASGEGEPAPTPKPPAGKSGGAKAPSQPPAASRQPPATVLLPPAGVKNCAEILALAGSLYGRPVLAGDPEIERARLTVTQVMAGQRVSREEFAILLAAHGLQIIEKKGRKGQLFLAARTPGPSPEAPQRPSFNRRFEVRSGDFDEIAREVEDYLARKNRAAPAGEAPSTVAFIPRTRRIIVRAASERILAGVDEIFTRLDRPDPTATHLHTYSVRYRRAEELVDGILEALGETEREQVSLVVPRKANLILIRATDSVYLKIESSLKTLDVPSKKRVKSAE